MKKFNVFKTIQLTILIVLSAVSLLVILSDRELYQQIATDSHIQTLSMLLWTVFVLSFLFLSIDFRYFYTFRKGYRKLDYAVSSDPLARIANRHGCDAMIEKYLDRPLPDHVGCVMFDLANIEEVNLTSGHIAGNELIHDFSCILRSSAMGLCFVGRNGGNKFLAFFENCTSQKMDLFLSRVNKKVKDYNNSSDTVPICYRYGSAYQEEDSVGAITDLVALSNHRICSDTAAGRI